MLRHVLCMGLILGAVITSSPALRADELDTSRERLNRLQERIAKTEQSLKQKTTEARGLREELRSVDIELRTLEKQQRALERELDSLRERQSKTEKEISELHIQVARQRQILEQRLAALYKGGGGGVLKLLFSGLGPAELETQFRYTLRIVRHDRLLLDDYHVKQVALEEKQTEFEALKERHQRSLEKLREHRKILANASRLKRDLLGKVRKDQRLLGALKAELEEKASRLTGLISRLEDDPASLGKSDSPFARQRGHLPWPVSGKVRIAFGPQKHPDLGTLFDSNGIEILAEDDTPIKALWKGRVAFASSFKGYGNLVIIDHGDGYHTLYAHASRIVKKVDDRVKQGDTLAYSGFPGTSGVYLEIRRNGKPVDPETWLGRP